MDSLRGLMIVFSGGGAEGSLLRSKIYDSLILEREG